MMKLISLVVMLVLTVMTAHSCSGGSDSKSNLNPANLAHNGIAALCGNQQATADAMGNGSSPQTLVVPDQAGAGALASLVGAGSGFAGGTLPCPTTTIENGSGG